MQPRSVFFYLLVRDFSNDVNHIHSETSNTHINPEIHHFPDFFAHRCIFPVEIWLLFMIKVQIILPRFFCVFPCITAKAGFQFVRRTAFFPFSPDIIVPVWTVLRFFCLHKPRMLIRSMVHNKIHNNPNTTIFTFSD